MEKNWCKNYDPGVLHTIDPDQYASIPDLLEECFKKYADDPCYINFNEILTFKQVDALSDAYAGFLQTKCQLQKGDRVAIMMPNCLQYPIALLGTLKAGMVNVNISPLYNAQEIQSALQISGAKCIVVFANFAHIVEKSLSRTSIRHIIVTQIGDLFPAPKRWVFNFVANYVKKMVPPWFIPNVIRFRDTITPFYQKEYKKPELCGDDLACLQFTEGRESGVPKCVMLTHRNLITNGLQMSTWVHKFFEIASKRVALTPPFFKIIAISQHCLTCMRNGIAGLLVSDPRNIDLLVKEIGRWSPSWIIGIKSIFNDLLFNEKFQHLNFSDLKVTFSGGMPLPEGLADRWQSLTHIIPLEGYALTEASPVATINRFSETRFTTTLGLPLPSIDIKICDEEGNPVPFGTRGEIWLHGPQVAKGYWNDPERTKRAFTEDGWFKTNDIGCMDEEGYIKFVDRKDDCIKMERGIVYPTEIENIITELGGVEDAAVVSILSQIDQQPLLKACIVRSDDNVTEEIILSHCRRHLSDYQVPHTVEFCDALPRSAAGFIIRRLLRNNI